MNMKRVIAGILTATMVFASAKFPFVSFAVEAETDTAVSNEKSGNALDTIFFGDSESEYEHSFIDTLNYSSNSVSGIDDGSDADGLGDGLTYRYLTAPSGSARSMVQFTLKASTTKQNYLTVRLNGSQDVDGNLLLLGAGGDTTYISPAMGSAWEELDSNYDYGSDGVAFGGRYYYDTYIIPSEMVTSDGTVTLCIAATGKSDPYGTGTWKTQTEDSKWIYEASTHTDSYYEPADNYDYNHEAPESNSPIADTASTDQSYVEIAAQMNEAMEKVMSWQFYGDQWENSIKNDNNAYLEGAVISQHSISQYSSDTYQNYTKAQWAKIAAQYAVDYQNFEVMGTTALYVNAFVSEYSGEKYYENTDFLNRIFATYDFYVRAQEASGGWCIPIEGEDAYTWFGYDYDGAGTRKTTSYYSALSKLGTDYLVQSFIELYSYIEDGDNSELKALFEAKLDEKIDGDLTGRNNRTRREFYIDMFGALREWLYSPNGKDFYDPSSRAGTTNQDFGFAYFTNEAVRMLYDTAEEGQRLNTIYVSKDPSSYIEQIEYKFGEMVDGEKWFSENGLGLEMGTSAGGWAGDYGALILKQIARYAEIAQYFEDEEVTSLFNNMASKVFTAASYFVYDSTDVATGNNILVSETVASSRNNGYTQKLFYNLGGYVATVLNNDSALRIIQKYYEDDRASTSTIMSDVSTVHVYDRLTTEQESLKYYAQVRDTIGNNDFYLPLEDDNTNDVVWYDFDGQVVVMKHTNDDGTVDRAYFTMNYRRSKWAYNDITRIHFTTGNSVQGQVDRIANVVSESEGGVYSYIDTSPSGNSYTHKKFNGFSQVKYGNYVVGMNQSQTDDTIGQTGSSYSLDTTGIKKAVDLVSGTEYVSEDGEDITVEVPEKSVVVLYIEDYEEPTTITATYLCGSSVLGFDNYIVSVGDKVTISAPVFAGYQLAEDQENSQTIIAEGDEDVIYFNYVEVDTPYFVNSSGTSELNLWKTTLTGSETTGDITIGDDGASITFSGHTKDKDNLSKLYAFQEVTDDFTITSTLDSVLYKKSDHDYYSVLITDSLDLENANFIELKYWLSNSNIGLCYHDCHMNTTVSQYGWSKDKNGLNSTNISGITIALTRTGEEISYKYSLDGGQSYNTLSKSTVDYDTLSDDFFMSDRVYVGVALTSGIGNGNGAANVIEVSDISISSGIIDDAIDADSVKTMDFEAVNYDTGVLIGANTLDYTALDYSEVYNFSAEKSGEYEIKALAYSKYYDSPASKTEVVKVGEAHDYDIAYIANQKVNTGDEVAFELLAGGDNNVDISAYVFYGEKLIESNLYDGVFSFTPSVAGEYNVLLVYDLEDYTVTRIVEVQVDGDSVVSKPGTISFDEDSDEEDKITSENLFSRWAQLYCYDTDMETLITDRFVTIDGNTYYFGESGVALKGVFKVDGKSYYAYSDRTLAKGLVSRWASKYFYDTDTCRMVTGFVDVEVEGENILYHFNANGAATKGWFTENGNKYYAKNGVVQKGDITLWFVTYHFDEETGALLP